MKRNRGFSLIEIAVVMVITALVLGVVIAMATAQIANQRQAASSSAQQAIKMALISFIARNNRLPCPADRTLPRGSTVGPRSDGVELPNPGNCQVSVGTAEAGAPRSGSGAQEVVTGAIPYVSLGMPQTVSTDGSGNRFTYQVTLAATKVLTAQTISGIRGAITIHSSGPGIVGGINATPPGNQINDCTPPPFPYTYDPTKNPCAAVAVIVSHGANGFGAFSTAGTQIPYTGVPPPTGADETENANGDSAFVLKTYTDSPTNPYDDAVVAFTPSDLLSPLILTGTLQDARGVLNANVQIIKGAIIAWAIANRSGLPGSYSYPLLPSSTVSNPPYPYPECISPACNDAVPNNFLLPTVPFNVASDPWGHHIRYFQIAAAISCGMSPGQAYILKSDGPDNTPSTADDVTYLVTIAELALAVTAAGC